MAIVKSVESATDFVGRYFLTVNILNHFAVPGQTSFCEWQPGA